MTYYQLYYHLIWATKNRQPLLTPQVEPIIFGYLLKKANDLGAKIYALNGSSDHVHLVVSIPPKISVSKFVGQIKAVASIKFNQSFPAQAPFYWQDEFAAFSFDRKRLPNMVAYVQNQKAHHAQDTLIPVLERDGLESNSIKEETAFYGTPDINWFDELRQIGND
jgi:putative transposase